MSRQSAISHELVEKALHQGRLDAAAGKRLHQDYNKSVKAVMPGAAGWHGFDDIETLVGLAGTFLWPEDPLKLSQIRLKFDAGHAGNEGTYQITSGSTTTEQGAFFSVPNNPLVGWAFINLVPQNGQPSRVFTVAGMMTDAQWMIIILLLNKVGPNGPVQPPLSAIRMG